VLQGGKFDPRGNYVRMWVPELSRLPDRWIHRPWEAPASVLSGAGVTPRKTYPPPIVDHAAARLRALAVLPRKDSRKAGGAGRYLRSSHQRKANGPEDPKRGRGCA